MPEHPSLACGYVQLICHGTGGFVGVCETCGPDPFPNRATHDEAVDDLIAHGVEVRDVYGLVEAARDAG